MSKIQARALFDFESGGPGELSFHANDILIILRQDIGAGWWEASNTQGDHGLVPETYFEISLPEPSMPPPPPPSSRRSGLFDAPAVAASKPTIQTIKPNVVNSKTTYDNDWDDDWDDDDDASSINTDVTEHNPKQVSNKNNNDEKSLKSQPSMKVAPFNRFSNFTKLGGDAYLFDTYTNLSDHDKKVEIIMSGDKFMWNTTNDSYNCLVTSPKKETKFHGIKTFIAYQITPSFSNIQVSRRYKHFDWLQQRLVIKFATIAIPPLPEKQISGRFEEDFVAQRLRYLQMWIDRMCQHPVVSQSEVFVHFLSCTDDKKWKIGKRRAEKDEYLGVNFFKTVKVPNSNIDSKSADDKIDQFGKFLRTMEENCKSLYNVGESSVKKHQGPFNKEFNKLGSSFVMLAKSFDFDQRPAAQNLTHAIENTGQTYKEIGEMFGEQPKHDMYYLLDGLHEYKGILSAFHDAVMVQKSAQAKISDAASKLGESELQNVQKRADVISESVLAEIEHFQKYRVQDFSAYFKKYLQGQIGFYKQITSKLESALSQYEKH